MEKAVILLAVSSIFAGGLIHRRYVLGESWQDIFASSGFKPAIAAFLLLVILASLADVGLASAAMWFAVLAALGYWLSAAAVVTTGFDAVVNDWLR